MEFRVGGGCEPVIRPLLFRCLQAGPGNITTNALALKTGKEFGLKDWAAKDWKEQIPNPPFSLVA